VVVLVWDGLRPDFVTEQTTPTLWKLAMGGVTFANHHSAYITTTEVNGAVLATGVYPEQDGLVANDEYRPAIAPLKPIMTGDFKAVRRGDELSGNHFLRVPTVAEILHAQKRPTAIAGAKSVALLHDRHAGTDSSLGVDVFEGKVVPESCAAKLKAALGKFPPSGLPKRERDRWTTQALVGPLWEERVPPFSLLWLSEPDNSQHETGPGSKTSRQALHSSDDNLALVLDALAHKGLRDQTDVIIVSDHGFSTITRSANVPAVLKQNGFAAVRRFTNEAQRASAILVVASGGTVLLYVPGHDPALTEKVVHCLQAQPFTGVLFARQPVQGAFTLAQAKLKSLDAPDIVLSLRWNADKNKHGAPGLLFSDESSRKPGDGMHGSLSRFDLHNTAIAAGPDFRPGFRDNLPTGNVDVAANVLWLLGVEREGQTNGIQWKLSGRVWNEALVPSGLPAPLVTPRRLEAKFAGSDFAWRQYLDYSEVGGAIYLDEGNGEQTRNSQAEIRTPRAQAANHRQ
jgi:arylsulfatase A-like enzyme